MKPIILSAFALGACALSETGPDTGGGDACARAGYLSLIGTNIAAVTLPASPDLRVYGPGDMVTEDYRPTRTNIVYDDGGTIVRVSCG